MITLLAIDPIFAFAFYADDAKNIKFMYGEGFEIHESNQEDMDAELDIEYYTLTDKQFQDETALHEYVMKEHATAIGKLEDEWDIHT